MATIASRLTPGTLDSSFISVLRPNRTPGFRDGQHGGVELYEGVVHGPVRSVARVTRSSGGDLFCRTSAIAESKESPFPREPALIFHFHFDGIQVRLKMAALINGPA